MIRPSAPEAIIKKFNNMFEKIDFNRVKGGKIIKTR